MQREFTIFGIRETWKRNFIVNYILTKRLEYLKIEDENFFRDSTIYLPREIILQCNNGIIRLMGEDSNIERYKSQLAETLAQDKLTLIEL